MICVHDIKTVGKGNVEYSLGELIGFTSMLLLSFLRDGQEKRGNVSYGIVYDGTVEATKESSTVMEVEVAIEQLNSGKASRPTQKWAKLFLQMTNICNMVMTEVTVQRDWEYS